MIDCEKDCPRGYNHLSGGWSSISHECFECTRNQLRAAEAENTALDKENTLINDRLDFKITELGLHIGKVGEQRSEIAALEKGLDYLDIQLKTSKEETTKWFTAATTYLEEIDALAAENEKLRNMDCEIAGDICDVVTMIDGAQYRVRIDKEPSCSR